MQTESITLVFTDVVNSTELTAKYPVAYHLALQEYRRIIRDRLAEWKGTEIRPMGDGFFVTFADGCKAAHWAKETQVLLRKQSWPAGLPFQVRIGLHIGSPIPVVHPDGIQDYDGEPVNLAARIMSEAQGEQVFVSQAFYEQTHRELAPRFAFHDRGLRELKGVGRTPVWQMQHPDLPTSAEAEENVPLDVPPSRLKYPPHAHFCGRENEMLQLRKHLLSKQGPIVALVGMGGMGKTQLAVQYAHTSLMEYPGGVYWLDARSDERLLEEYVAVGKQFFGLSASLGHEEVAKRVRGEMQQMKKPALLIFDNVTEHTDLTLLPSSGRLHSLLTTQQRILRTNIYILEVPRLSEEAALEMLQVFRQAENDREQEAARSIIRAVGSLPLALELASHHIHALGCSFTEYQRRLAENPYKTLQRGRDFFKTATQHEESVYTTIDLAVRGGNTEGANGKRLHENALKTLTAAACFAPNSIPNPLLFRVTGIRNEDDFEDALLYLWRRSLLMRENKESAEGRQSIHELIREYARTSLLPSRRKAILSAAVRVLADYLHEANQTMEWATVRNDIDHCYAVAGAARGKTPPPALEELLREIGVYLSNRRDYEGALKYFTEGLALAEQRSGAESLPCAEFLRQIGTMQQELSQNQEADDGKALHNARKAWKLARRILPKDAPQMADYCCSLGFVLKIQGRLKSALPFYLHALKIEQAESGNRQSKVAVLLNNIGTLLENLNDLPGALEHFQRALALETPSGTEANILVAILLNNAGRMLVKMDCHEEALPLHEQARGICETVQGARHPDTAACLYYMAEAQNGLKQRDNALVNCQQSLTIYEKTLGAHHPITQRVRAKLASLEADNYGTT